MAPKSKEKPKAAPAPSPVQTSPPIEELFTSLNIHIQQSKFTQAVKVANQVLSIVPGDKDAIRCKVVALIKGNKFQEALSTIQSAQKVSFDFSFYQAYCLYKQNKLDEALAVLGKQDKTHPSMLLESQILYRLGKMDACVDSYRNLQRANIDSLEVNLVAGLVSAGRASEVQGTLDALKVKATSSFNLAYNISCSLIEENKLMDAEQLLLTARRIGQETLIESEENPTDDDIEIKLARIAVQLAYLQQLFGHTQEAVGAYEDFINRNLEDGQSIAVAVNNLIAVKGPKDISNSLRKLDLLKDKDNSKFQLACAIDSKLSRKQKEAIYANRVLLLLHANKMDQARELVATLPEFFHDIVMPILLQAAILVRENKAGKAEELLGQSVENFPEKSKILFLAWAQVAAAAGHPQIAAESLAKVPDIQHMPATVATVVALKERAGDINGAAAVLDSAINWWKNTMTQDNHNSVIMQEAAAFMLKHGKEEEAAQLYEELVKRHGSIEAIIGLITTVAHVNVDKAEAYEKQLKPLPGLRGVDVDGLEKTHGGKHVEGAPHGEPAETQEDKPKEKPKKNRKRKPKYPKGFDPANPSPPPDPERWFPKRDRSSYRLKRKDKRAAQVRGSQGAVVREKTEATISNGSKSKLNHATNSKGEAQKAEPSRAQSKSSRKKSRN